MRSIYPAHSDDIIFTSQTFVDNTIPFFKGLSTREPNLNSGPMDGPLPRLIMAAAAGLVLGGFTRQHQLPGLHDIIVSRLLNMHGSWTSVELLLYQHV